MRYVSDALPGISRLAWGKGFRYRAADGSALKDAATLRRIKGLVIPPAWREVWICPDPNGHIQAVGRDQRGRKQYRYHDKWREVRDEAKFSHMLAFGKALPQIRAQLQRDMRAPELSRKKVLATLVRLLESTLIRIGNEAYVKQNQSHGLTTLYEKHVTIEGSKIKFRFRGKSGVEHDIELQDIKIARILRRMMDLPGQHLFQYIDDEGQAQQIESADVNQYLQDMADQAFSAKDFRTWAGTVLAAQELASLETASSPTQAKRNINNAVGNVAKRLGNTKAICRKCYIHPEVIQAYLDGSLSERWKLIGGDSPADDSGLLSEEERATLGFLEACVRG